MGTISALLNIFSFFFLSSFYEPPISQSLNHTRVSTGLPFSALLSLFLHRLRMISAAV